MDFYQKTVNWLKRCAEEGFIFIGPRLEHLIMFGDKINARTQAELAGIPMIPGSTGTVSSVEEVRAFAGKHGFPIIIKAVNGGGGRGMRMVASMDELDQAYSLPNQKHSKPSAVTRSTLKNICKTLNISKYRSSAIPTVTLYICTNVTVPYSAGIKNWSKLLLLSLCLSSCAAVFAKRR